MVIADSNKLLKKALKQLRKSQVGILACEEISELITELSKQRIGQGCFEDLCEEIADCRIMINLVIHTSKISPSEIKRRKKKYKPSFNNYLFNNLDSVNLESVIFELANLQKAICKSARKRKNKDDIIDKIVAVELSFEYLDNIGIIKEKDVDKWYDRKINRMKKRINKHNIV